MTRILYSLCGAGGEHYSPHVWKVIMALEHKQLEYKLEPVTFASIREIEGGRFTSVPVLNDNGTVLGDSFKIAVHLERKYPSAPSLFEGIGGIQLSRFVESYCKTMLHPPLSVAAVMDMYRLMSEADRAYFRSAREQRFGKTLEEVHEDRGRALGTLPDQLAPVRDLLSDREWLGGEKSLFADYILFGTLQWYHVCCPGALLGAADPVQRWFERCLDLFGGCGRSARAA
ncbi:glutathione S-transferase N-terminal domain-containing protein [Cribrihabitans neustonicus]|uniref:glutathione S-transferase N-terminal domain-containing protein n=1 Tax=Cribrihabitans neustonicus TaxID=1429085 RepID=UPI003B5CFB74